MPAPLSRDLFDLIVRTNEGGSSIRQAALRFDVSPSAAIADLPPILGRWGSGFGQEKGRAVAYAAPIKVNRSYLTGGEDRPERDCSRASSSLAASKAAIPA